MHKSRLSTILIDLTTTDFDEGSEFWSSALGREKVRRDDRYSTLRGRIGGEGGPIVGLQKGVDDGQLFHIDIETDDVEAEVNRLTELGAAIKERIRGHVVMRAPGGHTFCVVRIFRGDFDSSATTWE